MVEPIAIDVDQIERIEAERIAAGKTTAAVLGGIIPVKSAKMAGYMNRNVPGIEVPARVVERIAAAEASGDAAAVSVDIAARIARIAISLRFATSRRRNLI